MVRCRSGRAALARDTEIDRSGRGRRSGWAAHVELENAGDQSDRLRPLAGLVHGEADGLVTIDEEPSAQTAFILDDPMAATVSADQENIRGFRVRRGRLRLLGAGHGVTPVWRKLLFQMMTGRSSSFLVLSR